MGRTLAAFKHSKNSNPTMGEAQLGYCATYDQDEAIASRAMELLRTKYDKTYGWCWDCDGLVIRQKDCCLNRIACHSDDDIKF